MSRVLFFSFILCGALFGEERVAHFEGSPSAIAAGYVNVISGAVIDCQTDLMIPGVEPLHLSRSPLYAPNYFPPGKVKESWNFPFMEKLERQLNDGKEDLIVHQGSQELLSFKDGSAEKPQMRSYRLKDHPKGYTHFGGGRTALKNYAINRGSPHWMTLYSGSGEVRDYQGDPHQPTNKTTWLPLRSIVRPNGFRCAFQYDRNQEKQGVTLLSPSGKSVAYYGFDDRGDSLSIRSFDGRSVDYQFEKGGGPSGAVCRFLKEVTRSDSPTVHYEYAKENVKNGQLKKIVYPNGRGAAFEYWEDNHHVIEKGKPVKIAKAKEHRSPLKVQKLYQPAGAGPEMVQTHSFEYFTKKENRGGWTDVVDCYMNRDLYLFDVDYRLKEVQHHKGGSEKHLIEKFFWNGEGQLLLSALCDGSGRPERAKLLRYLDGRGNVTEERIFGNLTGEGKPLPYLDEKGNFNHSGLESFGSYFTYSNDGKNLLLEERHENGVKRVYRYLEGTDLVKEKKTFAHDNLISTESFSYDGDHCLIEKVEDDGERKIINRFKPLARPFGYPEVKQVFGWSAMTGELFLESYHYAYTVRGEVTSEEKRDWEGKTVYRITRQYDPHGNCVEEINGVGDRIVRIFDENDLCIKEEGPRKGIVKTFKYDWMNRCTYESVSYEGEAVSEQHYSYTQLGHRYSTVDEYGHESYSHLDRYGNPYCTECPLVEVEGVFVRPKIVKSFDLFGNVISVSDPLGYTTKRWFTSRNKPFLVVHPDGSSEQFRYTRDGFLSRSIDQEGIETRYHWDPLGRLLSKETPFGKEFYHYKGLMLACSVDVAGTETHYRYDPFGRLIETCCLERREVLSYDSFGFVHRKSVFEGDRLLTTEVTIRDPLERVVESYVEDPTGELFKHKRFVYDGAGNCVVEWDGEAKTEKRYDGKNRIIEWVDPLGRVTRVDYRKVDGGSFLEKTVTDPLGQQVMTRYDAYGKEVTVRHLDRFGFEMLSRRFYYDLAGRLIQEETRGEGEQRTLHYQVDSMGRVTALVEPLGKVTRTSYTPSGQIGIVTKPDGVQLIHTYEKGRLAGLRSSDGCLAYRYLYSPRGELVEAIDEKRGISTKQAFSPFGELIEESLPTGQQIVYQYDALSRIRSYSLPDGGWVKIDYNSVTATSVTRCDKEEKPIYTHAYTNFNSRGDVTTSQLIGKGGEVDFSFDEMYQLKGIHHPEWKEEDLNYDDVGNLVSFELNGESYYFSYDNLYQLVKENGHRYTFDPFQNRRSKDGDEYQVNGLNELTSTAGKKYTYDLNGNPTHIEEGDEKVICGYDPLNRLIFVKRGEIEVHFAYDPLHRRIARDGKPFYFFKDQEIGDDNSLRILGLGLGGDIGAAIALEIDGEIYAPLHDHNGSVCALFNRKGELVESTHYTAFGEEIAPFSSPWGFSSKRKDPLTGWLSFGRRDYDPETGRWITPDPLGYSAGPNLYTYVSNRPLTQRDPLGLYEMPTLSMTPYEVDWIPQNSRGDYPPVIFLPDYENCLAWWDRSSIEKVGDRVVPNLGIGWINGVFNWLEGAKEAGQYLSEMGNGVQVDAYHNSSYGHLDLYECVMGQGYIATTPVQLLHKGWSDFFAQNPNGHYLMICHSQGAIHVRNALITFDPELAKRIQVVAIAPGAYIHKDSCMSIVHYRTQSFLRDMVAHFADIDGARRERGTIKEIESHASAPLFDHFFMSPTYLRALKSEVNKFLKGDFGATTSNPHI